LAAMAAQLRGLPPVDVSKRRTNKQGAIRYLADEIAALQERGYTMEEVTDRLKGFGLEITTPTLKSYLHRAKGGGTKHSKARRRRRAAERQPVSDTQNAARADNVRAAPEAPAGHSNPAGPDRTPEIISQSRSLHPENASLVAHPPATGDTTTKVPISIGARPLPPLGLRSEAPKGDVPASQVSVSVPALARRDTPSSSDRNGS